MLENISNFYVQYANEKITFSLCLTSLVILFESRNKDIFIKKLNILSIIEICDEGMWFRKVPSNGLLSMLHI